jgi:hypothetical protein
MQGARADEDEFRKAMVIDVGSEGDRVKALDWPDDLGENDDSLDEAFRGHHGDGYDEEDG